MAEPKKRNYFIRRKEALTMEEVIEEYIKSAKMASGLNTQRIFAAWDGCSGAGPFTLKAGIQPDFILSARMNSTNYASDLKTFSLSAPLALNWNCYTDDDGDLWFLELRYHLGLTKMNKDDQIRNAWFSNGSIRNSVLLLTIGYKCDL